MSHAERRSVNVNDVAHGVVTVTLDRPDKLNAIDGACLEELIDTMSALARRGSVRAAILTGAGSAFSAGADIGSLGELTTRRDHRTRLRLFADMFRALETAPFPVIAAVNGIAYGAGFELVLASDIAISTSSARFALKEASVGLMPTFALVRGPDIIGKRETLRLAMTSAELGAEEAQRLGLVADVVEPEDLIPSAMSIASTLLANAPSGSSRRKAS